MTDFPAPVAPMAQIAFSFNSVASVRIVLVDNAPWFVARDIADALGYADTKKAVAAHCKRAKALIDLGGAKCPPEQNQDLDPQTKLIPEPDVYRLIVRSKLPSAEAFEVWLFEEVLPSIRKTGRYQVAPPPEPTYEKITRAQVDELSRAINRAFSGWLFHAEAPLHGHNALRVRFNLRTLADLPAADFDRAKAQVEWYAATVSAFVDATMAARRRFLVEIIGANAPWTPALLRKMTAEALAALPARPDWSEIHRQLKAPLAAR